MRQSSDPRDQLYHANRLQSLRDNLTNIKKAQGERTRENAKKGGKVTLRPHRNGLRVLLPLENIAYITKADIDTGMIETAEAKYDFVDAYGPNRHKNIFALDAEPDDPAYLMGVQLQFHTTTGDRKAI